MSDHDLAARLATSTVSAASAPSATPRILVSRTRPQAVAAPVTRGPGGGLQSAVRRG